MKTFKNVLPKAAIIFLIFTLLCGVVYTGVVTGIAQLIFPKQANGSIIEVDGKKYGSELLGQQFTDDTYMWGRIMNIDVSTFTDENGKIQEFEEKPEHPSSNLASMGIYIFSWPVLKEALIKLKDQPNCDFGKHIIPYCHEKGDRLFAYEYNGYWKDVGTLSSYWEANMELIDIIPEFNLYEEFWKIYTNSANIPPQYIAENAVVDRCIIANGTEIYGEVHSSVLGGSVTVGKGSVVRDSIIMQGVTIGENCVIEKAIIAEDTVIGNDVSIGIGSEVPNKMKPNIYSGGLATIGENSVIPGGVQIGKNTAISGVTSSEDYIDGVLASGETLIKAGDRV